MKEYRTWHEILMERFAVDWDEAIGYLDVALGEYQEDGDTPFFLLGLQNVVEARGGIAEVAKQAGIEAQSLSNILASDEPPRLDTLSTILRVLGCRLSIEPIKNASSCLDCGDENYSLASREITDPNLEAAENADLS